MIVKQRYGEEACNLDNLSDNSSSDTSEDDDEVVSYIQTIYILNKVDVYNERIFVYFLKIIFECF